MKLSVFSAAASAALLAGPAAFAGGYIAPIVETIVEIPPQPVLAWEGGYIGGTLGYAFGGDDEVGYARNGDMFYTSDTLELSGVNAGIRAGYRKQFTGQQRQWVIGGELSFEGGNIKDSFTDGNYTADNKINHVLALRVKAGVLNEPQDTLFYGILGAAHAAMDYGISGVDGGTAFDIAVENETMTGYILGLGVERKLNERLSVTGEWEYTNYGKKTLGASGFAYSTQMTPKYHNVKIGVNYQF